MRLYLRRGDVFPSSKVGRMFMSQRLMRRSSTVTALRKIVSEALKRSAQYAGLTATDDVHPETLLGCGAEQMHLHIEGLLFREFAHPGQAGFDHLHDGWNLDTGIIRPLPVVRWRLRPAAGSAHRKACPQARGTATLASEAPGIIVGPNGQNIPGSKNIRTS